MKKLGILGGGQLGKMIIPHAHRLDFDVTILDSANAVCSGLTHHHIVGDFKSSEDVKKLVHQDVVTVEIEHISIEGLKYLEANAVRVAPSSHVLEIIQDKGLQKKFLKENKIPTSDFEIKRLSQTDIPGDQVVVKLCRGGYDGRGVWVPKADEMTPAGFATEVVVEKKVAIEKEISVLVARSARGEIAIYDVVEMLLDSRLNLMDSTFSPARIDSSLAVQAKELAQKVIEKIEMIGLMAVEMFISKEGKLLINELAPRVHNSGHFSIEACYTDQFEQHLRAISNLPIGNPALRESGMTVNLIGASGFSGETVVEGLDKVMGLKNVYPHLYGKMDCRPGRKMGHVTILGDFEYCMKTKEEVLKWLVVRGKEKL
ncbi:MAG: 5-(carboxyamino)imidazole ribonucleotide synthase [Bdellovibrio sp.]